MSGGRCGAGKKSHRKLVKAIAKCGSIRLQFEYKGSI